MRLGLEAFRRIKYGTLKLKWGIPRFRMTGSSGLVRDARLDFGAVAPKTTE